MFNTPYKVSNFNAIPLSYEILISRKFENAQYFKAIDFGFPLITHY